MQALRVGILWAGTMGKQIALLCASHGMNVVLWNRKLNPNFEKEFKRLTRIESKLGNLGKEEVNSVRGKIQYVNDMSKMASCDLIIEAIMESYKIKSEVLSHLDSIVNDDKVISSNTTT